MRRLPVEGELRRHQPRAGDAVAGAHARADVGREHDVHAFEQPIVDHVGARRDQLFGDPGDHLERPLQAILFHQALGDDGAYQVDGGGRIMPLAVPRSARDERIVIGDAGLLRGLGEPVDVTHEADYRLAAAPAGDVAGGHAGAPHLNIKALRGEDAGDVLGGPELLKAELAEGEDRIENLLRHLLHRRHHLLGLFRELLGRRSLLRGDGERCGDENGECQIDGERAVSRHGRLPSRGGGAEQVGVSAPC